MQADRKNLFTAARALFAGPGGVGAGLLLTLCSLPAAPRPPGHDLFSDGRIRTFKIEVSPAALETLKKREREYVRCTIREGSRILTDAGVHLKGMGSYQGLAQQPSFAVKFDRYTPEQTYDGLTKIMLNNSVQDPTYLAELLSTQMFRDAGVPAARVTHAFVEFNERKLGLYVLIEAMNKEFLRQHFRKAGGNLYEAYLQDIDNKDIDRDGGTDDTRNDLKRLLEVCRIENVNERWSRLPAVLEVDRYVSHLAVEMFIAHTDGYAMNRNNYRLYNDPGTGRFTMIAHGADWGFANGGATVRPPSGSIITRAVLSVPEGRALYYQRARQLLTNVYQLEVLSNRVATAVASLKSAARDDEEARKFEGYGAEMQRRFTARHQTVVRQFSLPDPEPLKFTAGVATLSGWQTEKRTGMSTLDIGPADGRVAMSIKSGEGGCVASWRTVVILPAGKFRFSGDVRVSGVESEPNETGAGAGLRISGGKRTSKLEGDASWTRMEHEFEVTTDGEDRALVCELRAKRGEAWFAMDSLKIERLK